MKEIIFQLWPIIIILIIGFSLLIWDYIDERRKKNWFLPNKDELEQIYKSLIVDDKIPLEKLEEFRKTWKEETLSKLLLFDNILYSDSDNTEIKPKP